MDEVVLRQLHSMEEFRALLELQVLIWGMSYGDATSPHLMAAVRHNGGVIIGAEIGGQLVGFCFGFPVPRGDQWLLWSHMTGVISDYQGQGIGHKIKLAQRQWCLDRGYTMMGWTFDPMQRGNANFNFHRLGTVSNIYIVNHYGEMTDEINAGLASDRLEVTWHLNDERVRTLAEKPLVETNDNRFEKTAFLLRRNDLGDLIRAEETPFERDTCYVEIPYRVSDLKRDNIDEAQHWQLAVRWALQQAFERNYTIIDFVTQGTCGWYVLQKNT
jgi:predicted GNAT superfamily acetyltransferase